MICRNIIDKLRSDAGLVTDEEIVSLLEMDTHGPEFYYLIGASNEYSRRAFRNRGYVFVQLGLNAEPCSGNCVFCSMGMGHYSLDGVWRKSKSEIMEAVRQIDQKQIDDLFLMTTADYVLEDYLDIVSAIRPLLERHVRLVANIADFGPGEAERLKKEGITGAYHVNRLREGIDTSLLVQDRVRTLESIKSAGLELYYCIEPIGAEHDALEILTEIRRAQYYHPEVMAVMRRVDHVDSPLKDRGMITALELVKIAAVTNLVVRPSRAMNLHEPEQMSLLAGVNQLYAEMGANPRDVKSRTETGRGLSVFQTIKMLRDAEYRI